MSILDTIIEEKLLEIEKIKQSMPLEYLKKELLSETRDFKSCLMGGRTSVIAEIKRQSPSAGLIREDFDPTAIAKLYEKAGAEAVSVLTDEKFFGGKSTFLKQVRQSVAIPILRKEFIIDEFQIYESRYLGADCVLLIASVLSENTLKHFIQIANRLSMDCLVEAHSGEDIEKSLRVGAEIIGINNRNLDTFDVDINTSLSLKKRIPKGIITVSESGIKTREDVLKLESSGFDAILVGETLMREAHIEDKLRELKGN